MLSRKLQTDDSDESSDDSSDSTVGYYEEEELQPFAKRLKLWLATDTRYTYDKFNAGQTSEAFLRAAAFLDPRFHKLKFLTQDERTAVEKDVLTRAMLKAVKNKEYAQMLLINRERASVPFGADALLAGAGGNEDGAIVVKDQIKNYKCEASLPLDVCPLSWWADNVV